MTAINHFVFFAFFSGDVAITRQLRWIARMLRELVDAILAFSGISRTCFL
jgi:hypothetical protein